MGLSIVIGVGAAAVAGAAIKTGIKASDAALAERKYTLKDVGHDVLTGSFSGILAPVTGGMGGAVGKTLATKMGLQVVKTVGKEVVEETFETGVKQTVKTALLNPAGYKYVGENVVKKSLAYGAEMASDGVVSGAVDNSFRTAIDGGSFDDIAQSAGKGAIGGLILSPVIGGGFKAVGKGIGKLKTKVHVKDSNAPAKRLTRAELREKLHKEIKESNFVEKKGDIHIPKGKLAAPRAGFDESIDSYVAIIKNNKSEIQSLINRYCNDNSYNEEKFVNDFMAFLSKKMNMPLFPEAKKVISNDIAGGMQNTTNTIYYNTSGMTKISELMSTIMHELHHFLQQKEIFSTMSIEEFSKLKAKADFPNDVVEQKLQTAGYIKDFKDAGWEDVIRNYPKNTNPQSPYYKRAQKLIDGDVNYDTENLTKYFDSILETEAYDISVKTELEIEYSIIGSITKDEYDIANAVYKELQSDDWIEYVEIQKILQSFGRSPQNLMELVRECKRIGVIDPIEIIGKLAPS